MNAQNISFFISKLKPIFFIHLGTLLLISTVSAQNESLNGNWTGSYLGTVSTDCGTIVTTSGNINLDLSVSGSSVTGPGNITGFYCYNSVSNQCTLHDLALGTGSVSGTVSGNNVNIVLNFTVNSGGCSGDAGYLDLIGTISGSIFSGVYADGTRFTLVGGSGSTGGTGTPNPGNPPVSPTPDSGVQGIGGDGDSANPETGEPIQIASGNMYDEVVDYSTVGPNQLQFARHYNSLGDSTTESYMLGTKWRSTYDRYIRFTIGNNVLSAVAERPDGQELIFTNAGGGNWTSYSDIDSKLVQTLSGWILTNNDDSVETYATNGLLEAVQARNGYWQVFGYDTNNCLSTVIDSFNRNLQFSYQSNLLHTVTTPDGIVLTYGYDSSGVTPGVADRLVSVTYGTAPPSIIHYLYENTSLPFALTGVIDENSNRFTSWTYDSNGRATSSQNGIGVNLTQIVYNNDGSRDVISSLGQTNIYEFQTIQGIAKSTEIDRLATATVPATKKTFSYDSQGYISYESDWNLDVTETVNDIHGQPTRLTEAVGTSLVRTSTSTYAPNFHLPTRIVSPNKTTSFIYDGNGNTLIKTETDTSTTSVPYVTQGQTRSWTNTFDNFGHLLSATGPRTDVTATTFYTYDGSNNLTSITDPLGHTSRLTDYNNSGLPQTMVDGNGIVTTLVYDGRNRLLSRTIHGNSGNATTSFSYDLAGEVTSITQPDGSFLNYQYDTAHRLQSVTNSIGETITYMRDAANNITRQDIRNSENSIVKTQNHIFDSLSRLAQDIGASSQTTTYGYDGDGNGTSITDGLTNRVKKTFDALNRLITMADALTNTTSFTYNASDNLTGLQDPRSLTSAYYYDGFGRVIANFSPDRGSLVYFLDGSGNRTNEEDARGVITVRTFDKLDRVTSESYPASPSENIMYTYDSTNAGNSGVGRLTGYSDETGKTTLFYDERGNVVSTTRTVSGIAYTTAYGYDLADHVTQITYPSGDIIFYGRDSQGRIGSVSLRRSGSSTVISLASNVSYMPYGPISGLAYGNGLARSLAYDEDYRLTALTTATSGTTIQNLGYSYDDANDIASISDNLTAANSQAFRYDSLYRLTNGTGGYGNVSYSYDKDGNRLTKTFNGVTENYNYSTNSNWLLSMTKAGFTRYFGYTGNGNLYGDGRSSGTLYFGYGNRNRYNSLTNGTLLTSYKYNALGERLVKSISTLTTHYHYDESGHLVAETQPNGSLIREYIWLDNMPLAQVESDGTIYFIHTDHLNTPQKLTDANRNMVFDLEQQPFGEMLAPTRPFMTAAGTDANKNFLFNIIATAFNYAVQSSSDLGNPDWTTVYSASNSVGLVDNSTHQNTQRFFRLAYQATNLITENLRFPGQYFDAESQLNYNMNRDYDPTQGRYIQSDPIGLQGGINLHIYADNSPLLRFDFNGRDSFLFVNQPLPPVGAALAANQLAAITPLAANAAAKDTAASLALALSIAAFGEEGAALVGIDSIAQLGLSLRAASLTASVANLSLDPTIEKGALLTGDLGLDLADYSEFLPEGVTMFGKLALLTGEAYDTYKDINDSMNVGNDPASEEKNLNQQNCTQ